jgi:5-methylcytosine-specific restriction endonuclease McrA
MPKKIRDYKEEYNSYHGTEEQRKNRTKRVLARRKLEKAGRVAKGDGKEVDHAVALSKGGGNGLKNLKVKSKAANRSKYNK